MPVFPDVGSIKVSPGLIVTSFFGVFNHAFGNPIFDASTAIEEFAFGQYLTLEIL